MRSGLVVALALALGLAGCSAPGTAPAGGGGEEARLRKKETPLRREIRDYRVVYARGMGKIGYLLTYSVSRGPDSPVTMYFAEDLGNREVGWVGEDGQGERWDYTPERESAARKEPFRAETLPKDDLEHQVRRIFGLDPLAEIAIRQANPADAKR